MKKEFVFLSKIMTVAVFTALSLTSCSEDLATNNAENPGSAHEGVQTIFSAGIDNDKERVALKTSMDETRAFYWTSGDELWVDDPNNKGKFVASSPLNISGKQPSAQFVVNKNFPGINQTQVYYTGQKSQSTTAALKVTIAAEQHQAAPNDASHIATDGDCGTAVATRGDNGFTFTLEHKAAYLLIYPYLAGEPGDFEFHTVYPDAKLKKITVTSASSDISGTYNFTKDGLATYGTNRKKSITITCNGTTGFNFPAPGTQSTPDNTGCYVVIQPGKHQLKLTYTIERNNGTEVNITRDLDTEPRDYAPNTVRQVRHKLYPEPEFYYMWDAQKWLYDGVSYFPQYGGWDHPDFPTESSELRWYNWAKYPAQASYSCASMPNVNEMYWYLVGGDPHVDETTEWTFAGQKFTGGMWLKKWDKITLPGKSKDVGKDGRDLRVTGFTYAESPQVAGITCGYCVDVTPGKPSDTSDYFFLPNLNIYTKWGTNILVTDFPRFWSSSSVHDDGAYFMDYMELTRPEPRQILCLIGIQLDEEFRSVWKVAGMRPNGKPWFQ